MNMFLLSFIIIGSVSSAPTLAPMEETTTFFPVPSNQVVNKIIEELKEYKNISDQYTRPVATVVLSEGGITIEGTAEEEGNDEEISIADVTAAIETAQALIHKMFKIEKELQLKKKELEIVTTTTVMSTTPTNGFFGKLFRNSPLRKLFD